MKPKVIWYLSLAIWLCGCFSKSEKNFGDLLASAPKIAGAETMCGFSNSDAYRLGNSTWKDSINIRYFIQYEKIVNEGVEIANYFNGADKKYISDVSDKVFKKWEYHSGIPILEVNDKRKANLIVVFKLLENEGVGGMLALADFPPNKDEYTPKGERRITTVRMDLYDMWKYVKDRDKAAHSYQTVLEHELGHSIANLLHNQDYSIMNTNNKFKAIQIDDAEACRVAYGKFENFDFNGNRYTWVSKNNPAKMVTLNFSAKELLTKCQTSYYKNGHFLSAYTIACIQYIRTYYDCPIKILSSKRDKVCNENNGGATYSQHIFINALDFRFTGPWATKAKKAYIADVKGKKGSLPQLLAMGARGFGTYPSGSMHIDTREVITGNMKANGTQYIVWGGFKDVNPNAYQLFDDYTHFD